MGHRPYCGVQIGYECLYLYLALCPFTDKGYSAFVPTMTGAWFSWFIEQVNSCVEAQTLLVADGSRTHTAGAFVGTKLTFSKLPAYCPEWNPVEGVFMEVRKGLRKSN